MGAKGGAGGKGVYGVVEPPHKDGDERFVSAEEFHLLRDRFELLLLLRVRRHRAIGGIEEIGGGWIDGRMRIERAGVRSFEDAR